jgi:CRP-like cAMP-binding protein
MPTDQAYYLISGRAHAKSHPKPRSRMGKGFAAGDMIGFVSFLALDHYDLDIMAGSACEVLAIPRLVIEKHWGKEDIASWLFACSMASEVVKKQQPVMMGFAI